MSIKTFILIVIIIAVLFVALLLILAVALVLGRKAIQERIARFLKPDPNDVHRVLIRLQKKYPNSTAEQVAANYVSEQALLLGIVGFMTEFFGVLIPILGFTIDIGFTTLRQMRMVHVITALYGSNDELDAGDMEIRYMAMVSVGTLLPRFILKFIAGEFPIAGGVVNFGINWAVTNSIGKTAIGWNTGKSAREVFSDEMRRLRESAASARTVTVGAVGNYSHRVLDRVHTRSLVDRGPESLELLAQAPAQEELRYDPVGTDAKPDALKGSVEEHGSQPD